MRGPIPGSSAENNAVLTLAERDARRLGVGDIRPEHLLTALAGYERGEAHTLLASYGVTVEGVRRQNVLSEPGILVDADDDDVLTWLRIDLGAVRDVLRRELDVDAFDPAPNLSLPHGVSSEAESVIRSADLLTARLSLPLPQGSLHLLASLLLNRSGSRPAFLLQTLGVDVRRLRDETLALLGVTVESIQALDSGRFPGEAEGVPRFLRLPIPGSLRPDAARLHESDPDTPRAVRSARILQSLAAVVENAAAERARRHGWTEAEIDYMLHRAHVDDYQAAIRLAFSRALAAEDELGERLDDLITRGTPLAITRTDVRASVERYLLDAGFSIVDCARSGDRVWTYAEPEERQAVMVGAGPEDEPPIIAIKAEGLPLPDWYFSAADRLIRRASTLTVRWDSGRPWSREVFDTVYDSPVLLKVGGSVVTSISRRAPMT